MARTWLNDGQPDESGRLCLIIDPEDGTHPLRFWGRSREEILEKAAKTVEHGQRTISELRSTTPHPGSATRPANGSSRPNGNGTANGAAGASALPPKKPPLSESERVQLTADLTDPAKAPAAITRLVEHETGLDLIAAARVETVKRIADLQTAWSINRPDFPNHPTNYKLVNDAAVIRAGGYENITTAILDEVFNELSSQGVIVPEEDSPADSPSVLPVETPAPVRRPRGAASYRRTTVGSPAPAAASQTPKYTKAQIDQMSSTEIRRRIESEPGFAALLSALSAPPPGNLRPS